MIFSSFVFLFLFLPVVLALHHAAPAKHRNLVLLLSSYVFYGWWRVDFALLLVASTAVDFFCARAIHRTSRPGHRRAGLVASLAFNLGVLGYFKYANFGIASLNALLRSLGLAPLPWLDVVLPVGISFFTFQTMSYTIDVYRREIEPERNALVFGTYVAMFPQLVAGPIVRFRQVAKQLHHRRLAPGQLASGALMFLVGFNKKVLLADNFALAANEVFDHGPQGMASAWLGLAAFTFQIYFDFSGYSDMAVGLGRMLGFELPQNFRSPYRAESLSDLWRRWHITLTRWIRDYVYVSLGGNRRGRRTTYRNLAIAMILFGLWHGGNVTFLVWGAYHAALLVWERARGGRPVYAALPRAGRVAATMLLFMVGLAVFRSATLGDGLTFLASLVDLSRPGFAADAYWVRQPFFAVLCLVGLAVVYGGKDPFALARRRAATTMALQYGLFVVGIGEMLLHRFSPFFYFQF